MLYALDFFYKLVGNFGLAILHRHFHHQARAVSACQQVLRVDEQDERNRTRDGLHQGALRRRPHAPAAGDDGAAQEGKRRTPAPAARPSSCKCRCSSPSTRCCSSPSRCGTRRSSAGSRDLSAPDPTNVFNLFGVIHWQPPDISDDRRVAPHHGLHHVGQMRLNPAAPDPMAEGLRLDAVCSSPSYSPRSPPGS